MSRVEVLRVDGWPNSGLLEELAAIEEGLIDTDTEEATELVSRLGLRGIIGTL